MCPVAVHEVVNFSADTKIKVNLSMPEIHGVF